MDDRIQIFLVHAKEDKEKVLKLYDRLEERSYKPWLDKKDLIPGQNWREEIPKAIRQSDIFIACLSPKSVSKQGYVQREFRLALNEYAEKPPGTIYLIPLKLDDCEIPDLQLAQLGVNLRDVHWLDYWEPDGFENLVRAIEYQFGTIPSPEVELLSEKGVDYTKLRDLLAAGKWKEADQETTDRMLQVIGKNSWENVDYKDIDTFPCEDLHIIDQLWVKYSQGHFGFSVQKKIWQEVGGKVDYEAEKKLGGCVGWRKRGNWLSYSELTFALNAPRGHLPSGLPEIPPDTLGLGFPPWRSRHRSSSLASRAETCNL